MTALAANKEVLEKVGGVEVHPVVADDIIYKGAMCKINADGNLAPCASEAGSVFAGIATHQVDNTGGSAGDLDAKVKTEGLFLLTIAGADLTVVGSLVYATDDQLVTVTGAASLQVVGRIKQYVSATQVWVDIADRHSVVVGS